MIQIRWGLETCRATVAMVAMVATVVVPPCGSLC